MTDENDETQAAGLDDDPRFQVKWQKRGAETPPPPREAQPEAAAQPAGGEDLEALRRQLSEAEGRIRDLQDARQRAAADLANLRRRTEQERGDMEKFASMMLVAELLPVLDNFERALDTIPGNLAMLTWVHGVMLIERHFSAILERQGVQPIEAEGQQFSPHLHEAINEKQTADVPPGTITQVYQKGYTMHGRVIRPALVEIAAPPAEAAPEGTDTTEAETIAHDAETENVGP